MKKYFSKKETCRVDSMEICELETTIDWQASKIRELRQDSIGAEHSVCPNYKDHILERTTKLILQASEISTTETREKTAAKFAIAELAKYMFFPVKKTKFNKAVYDKLKQHTESASRRKSRALVEELISDGWLTETQEVNIKWINVRG